jgi:glycosyltransferase involved in cell wall biosynthesis
MRIAFLDNIEWNYTVDSVARIPLGGSQSALCYLARELAAQGHQLWLFNSCAAPTMSLGVQHQPWGDLFTSRVPDLDVLIIINYAGWGQKLRRVLSPKTRLILWTQHARDQGAIAPLQDPAECQSYDYFVFVSEWQRQTYLASLEIHPRQTKLLRNCIAPAFENLFASGSEIIPQKTTPPVLAYTSTPFRGLDLLLEIFPQLHQAIPGLVLKVFSSLQVYQLADQEDPYQWLYDKCRQTPGVAYIGSLPQAELAQELRSATLLVYPNHFPETSCISVLEAMASGCLVVTSDLGALPETTEGFGRLIPVSKDWSTYGQNFLQETLNLLQKLEQQRSSSNSFRTISTRLRWQVNYINQYYNWQRRATEWSDWLERI